MITKLYNQLNDFAFSIHVFIYSIFFCLSLSTEIFPNIYSTSCSVVFDAFFFVAYLAFAKYVGYSLKKKLATTLSRGSSGSGVKINPYTQSTMCLNVMAGE